MTELMPPPIQAKAFNRQGQGQQANPPSPLSGDVNALGDLIGNLVRQIDGLKVTLEPVMRPEEPCQTEALKEPSNSRSPMANGLQLQQRACSEMLATVTDIKERLEI